MSQNFLELESIHFNEKFQLQEGQKNIFKDVIEWKAEPPIVKTGRSSFLAIADENLPFRGIKIKGCGYFDIIKKSARKPSTEKDYEAHVQKAPDGIKEIHYQIEVNKNDEPIYSIPSKRPYGGQLYKKAVNEFKVNERLFDKWEREMSDFPFYYPVGYAEYKDLKYKGDSLGVTILGMQAPTETPLGYYFEGKFEDEGLRINPYLLEYWQNHVGVLGKKEPDYFDLLLTLKKLCHGFGKTLSHLHEHFVDFDTHFFNATVNPLNKNVILYDFDHVFDVREISAQKYFYFALKDFEIGLVAILSNFMLSGLLEGIVLFEKENKMVDDFNLIEGFYEGYFGELSSQAKDNVKSMWERFLMFAGNTILKSSPSRHIHLAYDFCEQEREKSYFDIFSYFANKITKLKPEFSLTQEKHSKIISKFLKQKETIDKLHQNVTKT